MRIGILETGRPPDAMKGEHGSYPDMFVALLSKADPTLEFVSFAAIDGEVPSDPRLCDAWLITGSRHGVYERLPWMEKASELIRAAFAAKVPVVGICFGHQLMAQALGGKVIKSEKGWGLGHHQYKVENAPAWAGKAPMTLTIPAVHQDQVVELPKGATVIASSEFCPNAGLAYDDNGLSFQGHPEFSAPFQQGLFDERLKPIVPGPVIAKAEQSLNEYDSDSALIAGWIVAFLRHKRQLRKSAA